jgi:FERM central domain/PTB domain (IRS-1 type)
MGCAETGRCVLVVSLTPCSPSFSRSLPLCPRFFFAERALDDEDKPADFQQQWSAEKRKDACEFVFKKKIFLRDDDRELDDPAARDLIYHQATHEVIAGNYPCEPDMAIKLAGLQMQVCSGPRRVCLISPFAHPARPPAPQPAPSQVSYRDEKCDKDFLVKNKNLNLFVPKELMGQKKASDWETAILKEHRKHQGKSEEEAKLEYLDIVRQWPYYGTTFFPPCKVQSKQKGLPSKVIIGVNAEGILLLKKDKGLIGTHPFTEICSWSSSGSTFAFDFGTEGHKYTFETKQGAIIAATIQTYIDILVQLLKAGSDSEDS